MRDKDGSQRDTAGRSKRDRQEGFAAALIDFARSLPDRLRRPETLLMLMAMLASLGAHMPPWLGLGALAEYFERLDREKAKHAPLPPSEVSFEVSEPTPPPPPPEPAKVEPPEPEREKPKQKLREPEKPKPEPLKVVEKPKLPEPPKPQDQMPTPPPPEEQRKQSITQKSDDPNVEPPPDAKYLAEENRRVEEETVARVTDEHRDDPEPTPSAPQAAGPEESGDSHQDERGQEKGSKEETEQRQKVAAVERTQPPPSPAEPSQQPPRPARPEVAPVPPSPATPAPTIVHDPLGSFVLAPVAANQAGRKGQRGNEAAPRAANIKVSWRAFEETFGEEQLARDRMPREVKRRGAGREKRWEEFRAAIENYIVGAKPGNTTALNAAADPFAAYLAAFHRNLHMEFAHQFLESLPALGELADMNLVTKVEIVVNPDGSLDRVGVVKSSGNLMYDFGAFNAVQRGAPYPVPPEKIRSPDGRVYMHWALHRNESQCGTWNANPFILKNPPRSPNDPKPDNVSPYRPGTKDPSDSEQGRMVPQEPALPAPRMSAPARRVTTG